MATTSWSTETPSTPTSTNTMPTLAWELITPSVAQAMLLKMAPNRKLKGARVEQYARDMAAQNWRPTPSAISIDVRGRLCDGQHRLQAIVRVGVPQLMLVARGVPLTAMDAIDTGVRRNYGDLLQIGGVKNANAVAAAVRMLACYDIGALRPGATARSNADYEAARRRHPLIGEAAEALLNKHVVNAMMPPSAAVFAGTLIEEVSRGEGISYVRSVARGVDDEGRGIDLNDPRFAVRERLLNSRASLRGGISNVEAAALLLKGWNSIRTGSSLRVARWRFRPPYDEPFPTPV